MLTKENIISTFKGLEEPIILDVVLERIVLLEKIEIGLVQSKNEQIIPDEEMEKRIEKWLD